MRGVNDGCVWRLSYGWTRSDPHGWTKLSDRPNRVEETSFHSFEAALKYPSRGTWWEITTPDGKVVVSSHSGFDEKACPCPSLCARQILNIRYPGSFPEVAEKDERLDSVSHDDGETWSSVLLGAKDQTPKNGQSKPRAARVSITGVLAGPDDRITIEHTTGRLLVSPSCVEIRQGAKGRYDLWVLGTPKGVYATGVGEDVVMAAQALGVGTVARQPTDSTLLRVWKPGLVRIAQKHEGNGTGGSSALTYREVRGFIRGALGVDRRIAEVAGGWGEHTYTYKRLLWHLTHNPTGSLIVRCKTRAQVEEVADRLREEIPELTDGEGEGVVSEEMDRRARDVIEQTEIHRW